MLVELQQPRDGVGFSVRDLDIRISQSGSPPPRHYGWPHGQRPSSARPKAVEQHGGIVGGDRVYLPTHRLTLGIGEAVEGPGVEHQAEAGADARLPKSRRVGVHDPHVDAGFLNPLAGPLQDLVRDVMLVTCQPRFASGTAQTALPPPRSSAGP